MHLLLLFIIFLIIFIIAEIGTIAFNMTGVKIETARFQAISLITNTGFTTQEAELIVQHRIRRKIASFLMVTFYVSLPLLVSTLVKFLSSDISSFDLMALALIVIVVYKLLRRKRLSVFLEEKIIRPYIIKNNFIPQSSIEEILSIDSDFKIVKSLMENPDLKSKSLTELQLKNYEIMILAIERGDHIIKTIKGYHTLELGDKLLIYGNIKSIEELFGNYNLFE